MKFRLGSITGTPVASAGSEAAGVYFALSADRDDLVGLNAIYYSKIKIWPGEGLHRILSLKLAISAENANLLHKYAGATNDFRSGDAYLKVKIGNRTYTRSASKGDIQWDSNANTLLFLRNQGPWADAVLRGDYITLEFAMQGYTDTIQPQEMLEELVCVKEYAEPVTTCNVYLGAQWHGDTPGAAAVADLSGSILFSVEGTVATSGSKKGGGSSSHIGQETTRNGITYPFSVWMKGYGDSRKATITYPAASGSVTCQVLDITIQD